MLLEFVVDYLIDRGYDVALKMRDLLLPLHVLLDNVALLQQFLIIFVEFIVKSGDDMLPLLQLAHQKLYLGLEAVPDDLVDLV